MVKGRGKRWRRRRWKKMSRRNKVKLRRNVKD